jgi:hypothetical protein
MCGSCLAISPKTGIWPVKPNPALMECGVKCVRREMLAEPLFRTCYEARPGSEELIRFVCAFVYECLCVRFCEFSTVVNGGLTRISCLFRRWQWRYLCSCSEVVSAIYPMMTQSIFLTLFFVCSFRASRDVLFWRPHLVSVKGLDLGLRWHASCA